MAGNYSICVLVFTVNQCIHNILQGLVGDLFSLDEFLPASLVPTLTSELFSYMRSLFPHWFISLSQLVPTEKDGTVI